MQDFKELRVWQKSHRLVLTAYHITKNFPKDELHGLTSQIRRTAASIPANIAEGCGKDTNPDFIRFLQTAIGSASELEYHLLLAYDLKFMDKTNYETINSEVIEVRKMLITLIKKIRKSD